MLFHLCYWPNGGRRHELATQHSTRASIHVALLHLSLSGGSSVGARREHGIRARPHWRPSACAAAHAGSLGAADGNRV
eukprot:8699359-Alexandrium_andersonii.AAC.1